VFALKAVIFCLSPILLLLRLDCYQLASLTQLKDWI